MKLSRKLTSLSFGPGLMTFVFVFSVPSVAGAQTVVPTTTTLSIQSNGTLVKRVAKHTSIQLIAQVQSATAPLSVGQVRFCDASAPQCSDLHLLGTAQLTSSGTATLALVPGLGVGSYRAEFLGVVNRYQPSTSSAQLLTVNGTSPTSTTLAVSGTPGNYTLDATVTGKGSSQQVSGAVHFTQVDPSNPMNSTSLGDASLSTSVTGLKLTFAANSNLDPSNIGTAVGDFNGDGVPDVVNQGTAIQVHIGDGAGGFLSPTVGIPAADLPAGDTFDQFAAGDFNGDGVQDVAATSYDGYLGIALGNGDGTFQAAAVYPATPNGVSLTVADVNHDGIADLVTGNRVNQTVTVFFGLGNGTFQKESVPLPERASLVVVRDIDGDGSQDILALSQASISTLFGHPDGSFTTVSHPLQNAASSIIAGDFNGDGLVDLAVDSDPTYSISIYLGKGGGAFEFGSTISFRGGVSPQAIALTDLNQDGIQDIAVATSTFRVGPDHLTVLLGTGQGNFTSSKLRLPEPYNGGDSYNFITSVDMNGDGLPDLIAGRGVLLDKITQTAHAQITGVSGTGSSTQSAQASSLLSKPYRDSTSPIVPLQTQ